MPVDRAPEASIRMEKVVLLREEGRDAAVDVHAAAEGDGRTVGDGSRVDVAVVAAQQEARREEDGMRKGPVLEDQACRGVRRAFLLRQHRRSRDGASSARDAEAAVEVEE